MTKKVAIALTIAFLIQTGGFLWSNVSAQEERVRSLYRTGLELYNAGDYKLALKKLKKAITLGKDLKFKPIEKSQGFLALGETQRSLGQYKEAEKTFNEAIAWAEKAGRKKKYTLNMIYNDLGVLYFDNSQFEKAEKFWKESEKISGSLSYMPVNNLARLYITWGKSDLASQYLEKAKRFCNQRKQKYYARAFYFYSLAENEKRLGNYDKSEEAYKNSLNAAKKVVDKTHFHSTIVQGGLADLYRAQSKFDSAEEILKEVLKARLDIFDEGNPFVAESMYSLANVLADQGKYGQAHEYAQKAIGVLNNLFDGGNNMFTVKANQTLANINRQQGKYQEAETLLKQCIEAETNIFGKSHLDIAHLQRDLAKVMFDKSNYQECERLLKDSIAIIESKTGPDHPERIESAKTLGRLYSAQENFEGAKTQYLNALQLSKRVIGENSKATADSARELGKLFAKQSQYDEAEKYLLLAKSVDTSVFGEDSPQVAADSIALAGIYDALGQTEKATTLLANASKLKQKIGGASGTTAASAQVPIAFTSSNQPVRDKWALAIGISSFKDPSINLRFAAKDATDFSNFLINTEKFKEDHVKLLTDENATRENIIAALGSDWLGKRAHKNDLVVVYVSSHGSRSQKEAGGINFLVAHDTDKNSLLATGIPMQWLTKMIKQQIKSDRVVLILDVCHSGAAAQGGKALNRIIGMNPNHLKIGSGQMVLCSSLAEQVSWESKKYENSVFTKRLMEALRVNKDNTSLMQAYKRLKILVEEEVLRDRANLQTPILWNRDWQGKDPQLAIQVSTD